MQDVGHTVEILVAGIAFARRSEIRVTLTLTESLFGIRNFECAVTSAVVLSGCGRNFKVRVTLPLAMTRFKIRDGEIIVRQGPSSLSKSLLKSFVILGINVDGDGDGEGDGDEDGDGDGDGGGGRVCDGEGVGVGRVVDVSVVDC